MLSTPYGDLMTLKVWGHPKPYESGCGTPSFAMTTLKNLMSCRASQSAFTNCARLENPCFDSTARARPYKWTGSDRQMEISSAQYGSREVSPFYPFIRKGKGFLSACAGSSEMEA